MKLKRFTTQLVAAGLIALPLVANAAGLGRLSVHSALGQPLAAEIELFAADKAELDSLSANLASDQAFREARVEFAPILSSLRFSVDKNAGGKSVLKVTSSRPVTDPFIDMLVELNWASGRLVREYTMLLDPPGMATPQSVAPVAPAQIVPAQPAPPVSAAPGAQTAPVAAQIPKPAPTVSRPVPMPVPTPAPSKPAPAPAPKPALDRVTASKGDTLSSIASRVRPEGVSLEQTLVGLYRENPKAFEGNVNRLKAGAILEVPSAEKVAAIPQTEAVRELRLQANDWRAYRQKLAGAVSAAPEVAAGSGEQASGKITPKVEDRAKPAPEAKKDVLKLSKVTPPPAANGKADEARALLEKLRVQEEKMRAQEDDAAAREKAMRESSQRVAMLEKQVEDMQKLIAMQEKAEVEAKAASVVAPAVTPPAPVEKQPAPPKPKPVAPVVKAPVASAESDSKWYEVVLATPLYWASGLAALGLSGVLWWMMAGGGRRRKTGSTALEDSIMSSSSASRPNTVIGGASSGGSVNTNTGDTSFLTDFSQAGLGAIDTHDVDPIAEADVYMAYGRDAQAEEILKEAIGKNPDRQEIRLKLLEIYAARRNAQAFEATAGELYAALGSATSPLWDKACEMGRSVDPTNPLYGGVQSAGASVATVDATEAVAGGAVKFDEEPEAVAPPVASQEPAASLEFDLRLPEPEPEAAPAPAPETRPAEEPMAFDAGALLAFDAQPETQPEAQPEEAKSPQEDKQEDKGLDFDFDLSSLDVPEVVPAKEPAGSVDDDDALKLDLNPEEAASPASQFDFGGLDLELGDADAGDELDEVGTKLDLARAYIEMGDPEGAREILNEVVGEGNEKQKADAQDLLNSLG